jgi:hypothetical protein
MKNLFLLLISTAITSFGIVTVNSDRYVTSSLIGSLNEVTIAYAQETKSNLPSNFFSFQVLKILQLGNWLEKKETKIFKTISNFYMFDVRTK